MRNADRIGQLKEKMWHLNDESYQERMNKSFLYCQETARDLEKRRIDMNWWRLIFFPMKEFLNKFFRKSGYRDGTIGLLFALHAGCAMFRACALLWDDQNRLKRSDIEMQLNNMWKNSDIPSLKN